MQENVSKGADNLFNSRKQPFHLYQEIHCSHQKEGEEKSMEKHEEDGKSSGYFRSVAKEECERGFRDKTKQDLMETAALKCLQTKTS